MSSEGGHGMRRSRQYRIVAVTVGVAAVEWLLFELLRMPYNPPTDMTTLLGQEKAGVPVLMVMIAAGWALFALYDGLQPWPSAREVIAFAALLCVLAAVGGLVAYFPAWPVTPPDLLDR